VSGVRRNKRTTAGRRQAAPSRRATPEGTPAAGAPKALLPRFRSELLLQQAIAGLLARIPGVSNVQIPQGAAEYGKDLVFNTTGPLGETQCCAAVVKNAKLTGRIGKSGNLREVVYQIEQALDTTYFDNRSESRRIHHVYVISPYEVSQSSVGAVAGRLASRTGQVVFLTGSELYRLFKTHWEDFLIDEASGLQRFAKAMTDAAGDAKALSTLAIDFDLGNVTDSSKSVYIEPKFHRLLNLYAPITVGTLFRVAAGVDKTLTREDLELTLAECEAVVAVIRHLHAWPFPASLDVRLLEDACTLIQGVQTGLTEAFMEAHVRKEHERLLLHQIPMNTPLDLLEQERQRLLRDARRATETLASYLQPVSNMLARTRTAGEQFTEGVTLLNDRDYLRACMVDDCLQASPLRITDVAQTRQLDLGQSPIEAYSGDVVVVGGPGTGKTSFCRRHALADAERFASGSSHVAPVYVALHRLAQTSADSFRDTFMSPQMQSALLPDVGRLTSSSTSVRFYLDGLDEIPDTPQRTALLTLAFRGADRPQRSQVVLTTRDYLYDRNLASTPRLMLSPLSDRQLGELAAAWLDGDTSAAADFMSQIPESSAAGGLVGVPLLATVTVLIYKRTRHIPENRARLYSAFVGLMCGGWDLAKGILRHTSFGVPTKQVVLADLANYLHFERSREFSTAMFRRAAQRSLGSAIARSSDALLNEVVRDGIITRSAHQLHFCHLSMQEFLAAKHWLGDPNREHITAALRRCTNGDTWWREVVRFYIGLSDNPSAVERWLALNGADSFFYHALTESFPLYRRRTP
jgi:NACHT domain